MPKMMTPTVTASVSGSSPQEARPKPTSFRAAYSPGIQDIDFVRQAGTFLCFVYGISPVVPPSLISSYRASWIADAYPMVGTAVSPVAGRDLLRDIAVLRIDSQHFRSAERQRRCADQVKHPFPLFATIRNHYSRSGIYLSYNYGCKALALKWHSALLSSLPSARRTGSRNPKTAPPDANRG